MLGNPMRKSLFLAVMFLLFSFTSLLAQGRMEGTVLDSQTDEPLFGANVLFEGTSLGAATDYDGKFVIPNVPEGNYSLLIRYVGYTQKKLDVVIKSGMTVRETIKLDFQVIEGEVVTITAQAEGQIQAINQQLTSNTISNVVSEARINELPDVNAAESIGRLPGVSIQRYGGEATKVAIRGLSPKYNLITVNGVRVPATGAEDRSVDLSLISSNMLDGIELKKAVTPDMDGDAIGGTVDLKLREAPEQFHLEISAQGGYNKLQDYYGNYNFSLNTSNRFFENKLGVIASFNLDNYDRSADKFSANYRQSTDTQTGEPLIIVSEVNLRDESIKRDRMGGSLLLDYQLDNGKIVANAFYNQLNSDVIFRINNMDPNSARHHYDLERRDGTTSIFTGAIGMEQDFDWVNFDFNVAHTASSNEEPENYRWRFGQEGDAFTSAPDENTHPNQIPSLLRIDSMAALHYLWIDAVEREENETMMQLNVKVPFVLNNDISGYVKAGTKLRWLDRKNDQNQFGRAGLHYGSGAGNLNEPFEQLATLLPDLDLGEIVGNTGFFPLSMALSDYTRDDFLDGEYDLGFVADESILMELTRAMKMAAEVYGEDASFANNAIGTSGRDYDGEETYTAAYIMSEINFGDYFTLIPGIRYEKDKSVYNGQRYREIISAWEDMDPGEFTELTSERENEFWLPMIHFQAKPTNWLQLRLARTVTLTRPDYMQYAPITTIDGFRSTVNAANSLLKPAKSTNYDLAVSIYDNYVGLFTVSGFTKTIDDLIISVSYKLHPEIPQLPGLNVPESWYQTDRPTVYTNINNPYEAKYKGFEIDWQTNFWYLPSFLKGLVLNINYTYIKSETTYQGYYLAKGDSLIRVRPPVYNTILITDSVRVGRMPDQPKHIANITIGYDYKNFSARLSFLYQTDISAYVHATNPLFDTFSGEYARWDLSLKQKVNDQLEVFANFNNLNARPDRSFRGSATENPSYTEYYGFTMDLGIKYRL